jgi:tyrosine-specific transport protein
MVLTKEGSALNAALLVTGCCIGAGMIGLPVMSAMAGFIPSTLVMVLCYFFATGTGLLLLEATLWFDERVNLVTMAHFALGRGGRIVAWSLFLFLFYCLFVAYIDGGGQLFAQFFSYVLQRPVSREVGIVCCVSFVGLIVYGGTHAVSRASRLFLCGVGVSYVALLSLGLPYVSGEHLLYTNWAGAISTIPILLICFGYQNLIPSLTYYVKKNLTALRFAIFVGNLIPFLIYFLWNFVILGILADANAIRSSVDHSGMVAGLLEKASASQSVLLLANVFSFFAILSPFTANTLAFVDFLKDGLNRFRVSKNELLIYGLVLAPPMFLTLFYPHLFLKALGIAGGFADVILFGILPALIVWVGRYVKKIEGPYVAPGGKFFLALILLLSIGFLLIRH